MPASIPHHTLRLVPNSRVVCSLVCHLSSLQPEHLMGMDLASLSASQLDELEDVLVEVLHEVRTAKLEQERQRHFEEKRRARHGSP